MIVVRKPICALLLCATKETVNCFDEAASEEERMTAKVTIAITMATVITMTARTTMMLTITATLAVNDHISVYTHGADNDP